MTAYLCLRLALRKQIIGKCTTRGRAGGSSSSYSHDIFVTKYMPYSQNEFELKLVVTVCSNSICVLLVL